MSSYLYTPPTGFAIPLDNLEKSLQAYKASPSNTPFDIESVPKVSVEPEKEVRGKVVGQLRALNMLTNIPAAIGMSGLLPAKAAPPASGYSEALQQIAEFAGLGTLFRSSKPLELTESETEYVVNCVKHIFANHIVLQVCYSSYYTWVNTPPHIASSSPPFSVIVQLHQHAKGAAPGRCYSQSGSGSCGWQFCLGIGNLRRITSLPSACCLLRLC
mgnify:CR=1 FL=1